MTGILFAVVCLFSSIAASLADTKYPFIVAMGSLPIAVISFVVAIWLNVV